MGKVLKGIGIGIALSVLSGSFFPWQFPKDMEAITLTSACPPGWAEDTQVRGLYLVGVPSNGTLASSLGTALSGATPPDVTYTPAGTNAAISAGTPSGTLSASAQTKFTTSGSGTLADTTAVPTFKGTVLATHTHAFTGTASATMRSAIAPAIYVRLCRKS